MTSYLRKADLSRACMIEASLVGADLTGAVLDGADLTEADVAAADFGQASFRGSTLLVMRGGLAKWSGCDVDSTTVLASDLAALLTGATQP